jgi:hypothetical protein
MEGATAAFADFSFAKWLDARLRGYDNRRQERCNDQGDLHGPSGSSRLQRFLDNLHDDSSTAADTIIEGGYLPSG